MTKKTKASLRTKREKSRRYQEESEDSNRPSRDEELYRMWSQKAHSDLLPSEIRKDRRELEGDDEEDELMAAEKEFNDVRILCLAHLCTCVKLILCEMELGLH